MKKTGMALLTVSWLAISGCGDNTTSDGGSDVGAQSDGPPATIDATLPPDFAIGGDLSIPPDMVFAPCKSKTDCTGSKVCEADAGACVECVVDGDCKDAARPRCDPAARACVPCLPQNDNCPLGKFCAPSNGSWTCSDGCKIDDDCRGDGGAAAGLCCGNKCVDSSSSNDHCGSCDGACKMGQTCCTGLCADTTTDPINCGGCGMRCTPPSAMPGCANSQCTILSCNSGFKDCDHQPGNGCEVRISGDPHNCGGCGINCNIPNALASCANSMCTIFSCDPGYKDCNNQPGDGCEINVTNNLNNCGGCGTICNTPHAVAGCANSQCTIVSCNPGFNDCDNQPFNGCEINITNNENNCGGCNTPCNPPNAVPACANSQCTIASCFQGFKDCRNGAADGCETNVTNDANNCGACGTACVSGMCSAGKCL